MAKLNEKNRNFLSTYSLHVRITENDKDSLVFLKIVFRTMLILCQWHVAHKKVQVL